jgi:predicted MPP superfamily phosphohydrolase
MTMASLVMELPALALLGVGLHRRAGLAPGWALGVSALVFLAGALVLFRRLARWADDTRAPWWRVWLLEVPYTVGVTLCFLTAWLSLPLGALGLLGYLLGAPWSVLPALALVHALGLLAALWGCTVGRLVPRVVRREVRVEGLAPALDGYTIAQLSDLHLGPYVPRWLYRRWVRRALSLDPDLVALTGDYITAGEGYLDDVEDFVRRCQAPDGVAACMGNHDYFFTEEGVARALERGGARHLRNRGFAVERGGATLWIAGVDDRWSRRDDLGRALEGRPRGAPVVLLAHDPAQFPRFVSEGIALTLSGHTHGGQFAVPFFPRWNLARVGQRYTSGLYREGRSTLFVHAGLGTSGPPARFGARPEVALLVLRAG